MFQLIKTYYGVEIQVSLLTLSGINEETAFPGISILASQSAETLTLSGFTGTGRFVDEGETEYSFPLSGSDFLTQKGGTLYLTITETLAAGWHIGDLVCQSEIAGVCGYGGCGLMQPGNLLLHNVSLGIILRLYVLPESWTVTEEETVSTPYSVPTVIR